MNPKLTSLLGGTLKWVASLGTGAVTGLLLWLLSLLGFHQATTNPLLAVFVIAAVAKFVGWFVATYAPNPKPVMSATRRTRTPKGNGPNHPDDLGTRGSDGSPAP